ncbi:hypothetical protein [Amycolatopsis sp. DSM 110486]|uniref:hypothetical protein n=1 Tax=Amycolatopsis sp. DSM 110486 TaxID=2865832 RepID=UPI001C69F7BC|nr:hypothetical protein [Amycolatopsis sp. DSM 110486]QYN17495.1 hypothetical protein K1T34_32435 [Amycolatopsis sp. DSM 110486]
MAINTPTEMAKHFRGRLKHHKIKAHCRVMFGGTLDGAIRITAPAYEVTFTEDEQRTIRTIAKVNGMTWVRGMPIDVEQMTDPQEMFFFMSAVAA